MYPWFQSIELTLSWRSTTVRDLLWTHTIPSCGIKKAVDSFNPVWILPHVNRQTEIPTQNFASLPYNTTAIYFSASPQAKHSSRLGRSICRNSFPDYTSNISCQSYIISSYGDSLAKHAHTFFTTTSVRWFLSRLIFQNCAAARFCFIVCTFWEHRAVPLWINGERGFLTVDRLYPPPHALQNSSSKLCHKRKCENSTSSITIHIFIM